MDRNNIIRKTTFNRAEYNKEFIKANYKRIVADTREVDYNIITDFCRDNKISRNSFVIAACKYVIENDINIDKLDVNKVNK